MDSTKDGETVQPHRPGGRQTRLRLVSLVVLLLLATILIPPFINVGRYKNRITQAIAVSLGRQVRLSSVELRLFPWPSFVLTNLSVAEDPAYGFEPVLHADTVRANLSPWSLWRGTIEFSSIHVENASLNLVRTAPGRWNFDSLFRTAAAQPGSALRAGRLPYLEATDSRVNIKDGAEKLPFSLINTDLSFWQENPGDWRLRLRGQPARTDVALQLGDTGIVRLEASLRRAPELRNMPVHLDLNWHEAQLGALARLLTGTDIGWRGDLTGEAHVDGTPDTAHVTLRLSATGVHRREFAPPSPLDFDANCGFLYDYTQRTLSNLNCDSPLGAGRLQLTGDLPGAGQPDLTFQLDQVPAGAGLDLLRTMRSGIDPSLEASGTVSGKMQYSAAREVDPAVKTEPRKSSAAHALTHLQEHLSGSITVEGFSLSGGVLSQPLRASHVVFEPATSAVPGSPQSIVATTDVAAGGTSPLDVDMHFGPEGYQITLRGTMSLSRARELAQTAKIAEAAALNNLSGDPALLNLSAQGPWVDQDAFTAGSQPSLNSSGEPAVDTVEGTVTLRTVNWRPEFLASRVAISEAVLHLDRSGILWEPIEFSYGPVKGTASVAAPANCSAPGAAEPNAAANACVPRFDVRFGALDAAELQSAFLGARHRGTLLDSLIARLRLSTPPAWPQLEGSIEANSLTLGQITIHHASAKAKIEAQSAELSALEGNILGGQLHGNATLGWAGDEGNEPSYIVDMRLTGIAAPAAGKLMGVQWTGGPLNLTGKINLSGFRPADLAGSAKGTLHFVWKQGRMAMTAGAKEEEPVTPATATPPAMPLAHFDEWSGEVQVGNGEAKLGQNQLLSAGHKRMMDGEVVLTNPPKVRFATVKPVRR